MLKCLILHFKNHQKLISRKILMLEKIHNFHTFDFMTSGLLKRPPLEIHSFTPILGPHLENISWIQLSIISLVKKINCFVQIENPSPCVFLQKLFRESILIAIVCNEYEWMNVYPYLACVLTRLFDQMHRRQVFEFFNS